MDVLIIGAGPAGLWSAYELAKKGKSVTVVEIKKDMENLKRACSMQVILDDDYEGEGIGIVWEDGSVTGRINESTLADREDPAKTMKPVALRFEKSGFDVPYHGKLVPLYNKYYHSPHDHQRIFGKACGRRRRIYGCLQGAARRGRNKEILQRGILRT